jgi:hypothetical protein
VQHRLLELVGKFQSQLGSPARHDHVGGLDRSRLKITVPFAFLDVSPGSRGIRYELVVSSTGFVPVIDYPVLCLPTPGNIASVFQAVLDRKIQSGSISTQFGRLI